MTADTVPLIRTFRCSVLQRHRGYWTALVWSIVVVCCFDWLMSQASGQEAKTAASTPSNDLAQQFVKKHCRECHSGPKHQGGFELGKLSNDFSDKSNREQWLAVLEQVSAGNMPPSKKPRPTKQSLTAFVSLINERVAAAESARQASQGRVVLRRLNRNEYANTVRDLLGVHVDLKDLLPLSTSTTGFDNDAESLHVSSYLMENYLAAADRVLDAAIANGPRPRTVKERHDIRDEKTVRPTGSVYRHLDDGVAIFATAVNANIQVTMWRFMSRFPGRYRFRISGYGFQTDEPVTFQVKAGPINAAAQQYVIDYFEVPPNKPTVVEFVDNMKARQTIRIVADGLKARPREVERIGADKYQGPGMVVQWVEVEGPLLESWPPPSHRRIFGDMRQRRDVENRNRLEVDSQQPMVDAERILRDFTRRAFRREVTDQDLKPFLDRIQTKLTQEYSFEQALRVALKAVLVSPQFLFLQENAGGGSPSRPLDDFALASRLSYFLWSSMPDEELLATAKQGRLRQSEVLHQQVERMLADPKAEAFTENFVSQWLGLRAIDSTMPDRMLYPEYDNLLKVSMVRETLLFFGEILKQNLSLTNFVASDFTMLNGRLAMHYGIPGVRGLKFRKVALSSDSNRGGLLTMASVLKVSANGTTTSPILRGAWVLERILGTPPPRPTVDVQAVEPDIRGATTIREQLAKHRQDPACAVCHVKIDPPGFALENLDVIGGWREYYRSVGKGKPVIINGQRMRYLNGPKVDASDELSDGRRFQNINEYKVILLDDKDQLTRSLAEKLVAYATGATPTSADRPGIENIVRKTREQNYGLRSLIHEVVQSRLFQHK